MGHAQLTDMVFACTFIGNLGLEHNCPCTRINLEARATGALPPPTHYVPKGITRPGEKRGGG